MMRKLIVLSLLLIPYPLFSQSPFMQWDFEEIEQRKVIESPSQIGDTLEGNYEVAPGIQGKGLRLDGFTTCIIREPEDKTNPGKAFTIEGWIALGNYPWNWCPLLTTEKEKIKGASGVTEGYRLMIGPLGQVSLQVAIGEQWVSCSTKKELLPLRKWMHIAATYTEGEEMKIWINGELKARMPVHGSISYSNRSECRLGMVKHPQKPSDIHRTWGTVASYFGLDGIIDEVKVYDQALDKEEIGAKYADYTRKLADIKPRRLPDIENHPGRFGAFYTQLNYYPGWDELWPVADDPDVVVCFDQSPVKMMFWRGFRYGPAWVSENNNWMSDQSVEAWQHGDAGSEGCFEHMQDRHCRFSHVRIIENNEARAMVHWRYAPVSAHDHTWNIQPKTGWECWIDEYYYIYPDASAIRKVSWDKGSLGHPRQFQESLVMLHPEQSVSDLLEKDYAHVANYQGETMPVSFVEDPGKKHGPWDSTYSYTIQQYNFKSKNKPFICFEPGNEMFVKWEPLSDYNQHSGNNHFPVGQARCDGRTSRMADRPSHTNGFPISDPVIQEKEGRYYWNGLYGMNTKNMDELVSYGKAWAHAPELTLEGEEFLNKGYDKSQRCDQIKNTRKQPSKIKLTLKGSNKNPVYNPAFYIKNWNAEGARVLVNGKESEDYRMGVKQTLDGTHLVVFLFHESEQPVQVTVTDKP
ncbi:MAG: LamG domain-containing protein [Bacteroidales bacterium]|nr:LamG domain-containing protein [Bacteroidales bacterium]